MNTKSKQSPTKNPNPVLSVAKDGTILYSNESGEHLLNEWRVVAGERLPSNIVAIVQKVLSHRNPIRTEINIGKKVYLISFYHFPEDKCVNIYGFDINVLNEFGEEVIESEGWELENVELAGIIDIKTIKPFFDDFHKLTHIPIGLRDIKNNVLVGAGFQDICAKFHRVNPETYKKCIDSSKELAKGILPGEYKLYKCKNNLWDILTPVTVSNQHVGNIIAGQFFFDDEPIDYELFRSQARKYGFNEDEYIAALEKVPRLSREAVDKCMSISMAFANMISQLSYTNIKLAQSLAERNTLVNELWESEKREQARSDELAAVLDAVPVAVFTARDPKVLQLIGNRLSYEWLQLPVGTNFSKSATEEEKHETFKLFKDGVEMLPADMPSQMAAAGIEINDCELDIVSADGSIRHVLGNARPLRGEQGNLCGSVSAFIDITERKKSEEALRFSSIYNRSLIEASLDPLVTIGRDGKITDVNRATEEVTGYPRNELIGTDFSDYFTEPENASAGYQQVFTNGKVLDYPLEIQHKDGHTTPVLYNASVYRDENNEVVGVFAAARDITERKKSEEKLRESEEKYRNIVETANEGIVIINEEFRAIYVNQRMADMVGYSVEECLNKPIWDFISEESIDIVKSNFIQRSQGINANYEFKLRHKNGSHLWVISSAKALFNKDGKFMGSLSMLTDISKRKKAEDALAKIEIARKKEIHHRIKNNLQVISSLLDLQADKFNNRKFIKYSEVLEAFRESQDRVISMALIHEELYRGGGLEKLNFLPYVEKLTENLFHTYNLVNNDIRLKLNIENNVFFEMDVAVPLGMIINELVSNSFKHAFKGRNEGEIQIKLHREENGVNLKAINGYLRTTFTLIISDNGVGIPKNLDIENLDSLGLQLVTSLVDQLGGNLEVRKDNGTKFIIKFTVTVESNRTSGQLQS